MATDLQWWQEEVIYQILVQSYRDSNGDGSGDLPGIIEKLDYCQWLGVGAIWLTPIYASPWRDMGYDVADFAAVHPKLGTLQDMDRLIAEAHKRNLKILLDWVPNHTSDEHPWFQESRSSRDNPKRDWYVWADGKENGAPPTNWISVFGGSVWQWDDQTGQFYLHHFLKEQPDLNWHNPEVQEAMFGTLRFWLDRGVDGFRIDALDMLLHDPQLRDNPPNPDFREGDGPDSQFLPEFTRNQPGIHEIIARIRELTDAYKQRVLLGELYLPLELVATYYGQRRPELHLPLNLRLAWTPWVADSVREVLQESFAKIALKGWPAWSISMHDCPRLATRCLGEQTRLAAMMLFTLPGTATLYYGEEIGMKGTPIPAEHARDPQGKRTGRNRDPERTPMQWSNQQHAGFSTAEPWLPICEDFTTANVSAQSDNPKSLLSLYRHLLQLRKRERALRQGEYAALDVAPNMIAYRRHIDGQELAIYLNLGNEAAEIQAAAGQQSRIILSTFLDRIDEHCQGALSVRGNEGLIVEWFQ